MAERVAEETGPVPGHTGPQWGVLSLSLTGRARVDFKHGETTQAAAHIAQLTRQRGLIPGIFTPGGRLTHHARALG
jgi:4-hydroxy-2-oxoheptanedioate aldolase